MDCSAADMPTNVVQDCPASDVSSDDEPLINLKISASAKKPEKIDDKPPRANGTNNKKAGDVRTDESSDNEPLIKSAKAAKKPSSLSPRKSVNTKKKASLDEDDSLEDEPLSTFAKKLDSKRQRKGSVTPKATPVTKSKRNAARKTVKYAESSTDSSDDEPLALMKKKLTKAPKEQKNGKKTKPKLKDKSLKDSSSSDDDVPLLDLIAKKKKPVKKNTKKTAGSQVSASRKRREPSDESSEDEPLINLVKKKSTNKQTKNKRKAPSPKKRATTPKKPRKKHVSGSESNSSDDEPLIHQAAKHPQVTKILRIILERCDGEETGAAQSLNQTTTDEPNAERDLSEESKASEESSSEE